MEKYTGDDLLKIFHDLNIEMGNLNPSVIKAWFDTDSEDLLNWFCSSITEENYVTPQENIEYSSLENILTDEEIEKEIKLLETNYPDLFQCESNIFEIELSQDSIEILEEQQKDYDHQLAVNKRLNESLLAEFAKVSAEEIKSNCERETAYEECFKLSKKLDEINSNSFDQIAKYQSYLNNYEFAEIPEFINNQDITEYEEKFHDVVSTINSAIKVDNDLLETSGVKGFVNILSQLEKWIFHSKISCAALQMEEEILNQTIKFLDNYDLNAVFSFVDQDSIQLNIDFNRGRQSWMLKTIEESSLKLAEYYVNQPTLQCSQNELKFCQTRLKYLNKIKEVLTRILTLFVVMYDLHLQEKMDIMGSDQFFRGVFKYISHDLQNCTFRNDSMLKLIKQYEHFKSQPIENRFKLIGDFGMFLMKGREPTLLGVLEETNLIRNQVETLQKKHFSDTNKDLKLIKKMRNNVEVFQKFLTSGPTSQIVTIPNKLQMLLSEVDMNLIDQNTAVKLVMQISQKTKDKFSDDKWLYDRNHLWMHFIMDSKRMFSLLEQLKSESKLVQNKNN